MRRFTVALVALLILSGYALGKCYQAVDGSFICIYSKTGVARFSYATFSELMNNRDACNLMEVRFVNPRLETLEEVKIKEMDLYERQIYWLTRVFSSKRPAKLYRINGCTALSMIGSPEEIYVTGKGAVMHARTFELWGESPKVSSGTGATLLGLSAALNLLAIHQESAMRKGYLVDERFFDVNSLLEDGRYLYWFSLRKSVTEPEFRMLIEDPPYKTEEIFRYLKLTKVFFRHNEHLKYVSDCSKCHHTGSYVSCGTCHAHRRMSNPYNLMYESWYAIGKTCTKCHANFDKPVPWNCEGLTERQCVGGSLVLFGIMHDLFWEAKP